MSDATLTFCARTDLGRERDTNEDAFVVADARSGDLLPCLELQAHLISGAPVLVAVADGMGGHSAGEVASDLALTTVREALARELRRGDPVDAVRAAVEHANSVVAWAGRAPERQGMGSTLVLAVVRRDHALVASVGDSRAYLLRGRDLVQVTKDQSYLQLLIDMGKIPKDQIATYTGRNEILHAIGRAPSVAMAVSRIELRRGDSLLLCSDGLTGDVTDDAIRDIVSEHAPDVACAKLVDAANHAGGHDNITVVVASLSGESVPASIEGDHVSVEPLI